VPLHVAAWKGHYKAASTLVNLGANIDATDEVYILTRFVKYSDFCVQGGDTPLHEAARFCHSNTLKALLTLGANITIENKVL